MVDAKTSLPNPALANMHPMISTSAAGPRPFAVDCLYILQAAVGLQACPLCVCDVDSNCGIFASDALRCLNNAVRVPGIELFCGQCA